MDRRLFLKTSVAAAIATSTMPSAVSAKELVSFGGIPDDVRQQILGQFGGEDFVCLASDRRERACLGLLVLRASELSRSLDHAFNPEWPVFDRELDLEVEDVAPSTFLERALRLSASDPTVTWWEDTMTRDAGFVRYDLVRHTSRLTKVPLSALRESGGGIFEIRRRLLDAWDVRVARRDSDIDRLKQAHPR